MARWMQGSYLLLTLGIIWTNLLQAQCNSWEEHPKGIQSAKEAHQRYRDLFRAKQYEAAFPIWQALFQSVQMPKEAPSRHFKDGIKMYRVFAKKENIPTQKALLVDTIINLYQQMEICIGKNSQDKAWLGYSLYALKAKPALAVQALEEALVLGEDNTSSMVIVPLAQLTVYLYQKRVASFTKDYLTQLYYKLERLVEANQDEKNIYREKWMRAKQEFLRLQDELEEIWDCEFFEKQWQAAYLLDSNNRKQNSIILKKIKQKCGNTSMLYQRIEQHQEYLMINYCDGVLVDNLPLFRQGNHWEKQAASLSERGDSLQAKSYLKKAFILYEQAIEKRDSAMTDEERGRLCYRLAYKEYLAKDYIKARKFCRQATTYKTNWGAPYLLVGDMYASSLKLCQSGDPQNLSGRVVIWVALDEWRKAIKVDPKSREKAEKKIKTYKKYLPLIGEGFQASLKEGESYKVACWINQRTRVQFAQE
ncbi:hypothetical protein [Aureispira anguillae]|uniref:Tetratricopeptide repeat protein n=1 Tax=Aureispira anguillae TaxID=2864201 RepID=A0A916DUZ9_9BACT|nr:hypothetical protein [Aureispira anguillae]BDS14604.1 hypothetical protein AsAng_0053850 [Aureispira anguillae]